VTDLSGSVFFSRFAFPPNSLGYCGPSDTGLLKQVMVGGLSGLEEMTHIIPAFAGAWPYLELIAACANRDSCYKFPFLIKSGFINFRANRSFLS